MTEDSVEIQDIDNQDSNASHSGLNDGMQLFRKIIGYILIVVGVLDTVLSITIAIGIDDIGFRFPSRIGIVVYAVVIVFLGLWLARTDGIAFFDFHGRISRTTFWLYYLCVLVTNLIIRGFSMVLMVDRPGFLLLSFIFFIVWGMLSGWVMFATQVKRLHDLGITGWAVVIFNFIPAIISFILIRTVPDNNVIHHIIVSTVIFSPIILLFGIRRGDLDTNKYGPNPLGKVEKNTSGI